MSGGTIRQPATVLRVTPAEVEVEVCRPDACAACKARRMCSDGETGKRMTLLNDGQGYAQGEEVILVMRRSSGIKAIVAAYLTPVALIVGILLGAQSQGMSEITAGWMALGALAVYFLILRLLRRRLQGELTIEIEKEIRL